MLTETWYRKCTVFSLWTCCWPCRLPPFCFFRVSSGSVKPVTWRPTSTGSTDWVTWWPLRSVWYVCPCLTHTRALVVQSHFILKDAAPLRLWYKSFWAKEQPHKASIKLLLQHKNKNMCLWKIIKVKYMYFNGRWLRSLWFTSCCVLSLQPVKKKHRARIIEFFIDVAQECFNIGNFNSLMAINSEY